MERTRMKMAPKPSATRRLPFPTLSFPLVIDPHAIVGEMKEKMDSIISPLSSNDCSSTCYFKVNLRRFTVSAFGQWHVQLDCFQLLPEPCPFIIASLHRLANLVKQGKLWAPWEQLQVVLQSVLLSREGQGKLLIQSVVYPILSSPISSFRETQVPSQLTKGFQEKAEKIGLGSFCALVWNYFAKISGILL